MATNRDLEARFWKALRSDMTMMLALVNAEQAHARPMTAQLKAGKGPIWFFTAKDNAIVKNLPKSNRGVATFISKERDIKLLIGLDPKKGYRSKEAKVDLK